MRYKIGTVAKLLGISTQAVHLYEQNGIIRCQKDAASGYRTFSLKDINILLRARLLKSLGFSLVQIADMLNECDEANIFEYYAQQEAALAQEIDFTRYKLDALRRMHAASRWAVENVDRCEFAMRPALYFFPYARDETISSIAATSRASGALSSLDPFLQKAALIPQEHAHSQDYMADRLFYLEKDFADLAGFTEADGGCFLPARRCLRTAFTRENQTHIPLQCCLSPAFAFMEKEGLVLDGDIFINIDLLMKRSTSCRLYAEAWIPVR